MVTFWNRFRAPWLATPGLLLMVHALPVSAQSRVNGTVVIDARGAPVNIVVPSEALGAGVDGHWEGESDRIFTPANLRAMRAVGLRSLTVRLRTELGIESWHWNPRGRWSDSANARGYWISDDSSGVPIETSFGYRLPRRGNSIDQANNDGYSRLDDGDSTTFWKSNPYLDQRVTGEAEAAHPQWVLVDLGAKRPVNAARLTWGAPFATRFVAQYWQGEDPRDPDEMPAGAWRIFARGREDACAGGTQVLRLTGTPVAARFVRFVLLAGSHTAPEGTSDWRDSVGFALREIFVGVIDGRGVFRDAMRHGVSRQTQSLTFVSSTDSWHRASDRDAAVEQPGVDRIFASGLAESQAPLIPLGTLFDTPQNAAALLRYLERRHRPIRGLELGEEPDGQYTTPEDYAALYAATARALRAVDSTIPLGGPSFQSLENDDMMAWPDPSAAPAMTGAGQSGWMRRFLAALARAGMRSAFQFFSFEWYPFDDICNAGEAQLLRGAARLGSSLAREAAQDVPRSIPWYMTEYGYSAFAGSAEVSILGALHNADAVGAFLTAGGGTAFLYGYEPGALERNERCESWGGNMLFEADASRRITHRVATYYESRMLTADWLPGANDSYTIHRARVVLANSRRALVTAYAARSVDGSWSLLLVNRSASRTARLSLGIRETGRPTVLTMPAARVTRLSGREYRWVAAGARGHPDPEGPPARFPLAEGDRLVLPPYSVTVVRSGPPRAAVGPREMVGTAIHPH